MAEVRKVIVIKEKSSTCECWGRSLKEVHNAIEEKSLDKYLYLRIYPVIDDLMSADFEEHLIGSSLEKYEQLRRHYWEAYDEIMEG